MKTQNKRVHASEERVIQAPAQVVYRVISDYRQHHPAILPSAFTDLTVEEGGVGEGTVIAYSLRLGGRTRRARARVTEPEPGRVLAETDLDRDLVTTFTVTDTGNGRSRVRIETQFEAARGLQGWIERRFAPGMLRKLYQEELGRLEAYARAQAA